MADTWWAKSKMEEVEMTPQEFLEQNLAGFENDSFAKDKVHQIITDNKIETVIETGTYLGSTTKHFAQWCKYVHTIEINDVYFNKSFEALKEYPNIKHWHGNSPEVLDTILNWVSPGKDIFFWLDAHWLENNPLLDELAVIAKHKIKPIIAIHDFKVEGYPELGFDTYNKQDYDWEWIKESIENIYGKNGYVKSYNSESTGAKRGIIFLQPKLF